jgi:hypothetical protein
MRNALLFLLALATPSVGAAQSSTGELRDEVLDHRVSGDLGFFYRTQGTADIGVLQPSLYGTFTVARFGDAFVQVDAAWRFVGLFGTTSAFRASNPYAGVRFGTESAAGPERWRARGGLGLTLPLTNLYDDFRFGGGGGGAGLVAHLLAAPMQGVQDAWLGLPLNVALVLRGDFEYRHTYFVVGGDLAFASLFPVEYDGRTGNTVLDLQLGAYAGARPIPELAIGVRFSAVAVISTNTPPGTSNTEGLTSLAPFVRGEIGPAFVEGRLLMNLDEPYGFAFDSSGSGLVIHVWAVQLSGGGSF